MRHLLHDRGQLRVRLIIGRLHRAFGALALGRRVLADRFELAGGARGGALARSGERRADFLGARESGREVLLDARRELPHQPLELAAALADVGDERLQVVVPARQRVVDDFLVGGELARNFGKRRGVGGEPLDEALPVLAGDAGDAIELGHLIGDRRQRALQVEHAVAEIALDLAEPAAGQGDDAVERRAGVPELLEHLSEFVAQPVARRRQARNGDAAPVSIVETSPAREASRSCESFSNSAVSASVDCRVAISAVPRSAAFALSSSSVTPRRCCEIACEERASPIGGRLQASRRDVDLVREARDEIADRLRRMGRHGIRGGLQRRRADFAVSSLKRPSRPPMASLEFAAAAFAVACNVAADFAVSSARRASRPPMASLEYAAAAFAVVCSVVADFVVSSVRRPSRATMASRESAAAAFAVVCSVDVDFADSAVRLRQQIAVARANGSSPPPRRAQREADSVSSASWANRPPMVSFDCAAAASAVSRSAFVDLAVSSVRRSRRAVMVSLDWAVAAPAVRAMRSSTSRSPR